MSQYKQVGTYSYVYERDQVIIEGWEDMGVFSVEEPEDPTDHCQGCFFEAYHWTTCKQLPDCTGVNFKLT